MISFDEEGGDGRFNLRAAGVCVRPSDGKVLLHRTVRDNFWSLPGGRCDFHEAAPATLAREMAEEIGVTGRVEVGRLLFVAETFYSYLGRRFHEVGLYFLMSFPEDPWVYEQATPFDGHEPSIRLIFAWMDPLEGLEGRALFPTFLPAALADLPGAPRHIVHVERAGVPGDPLPY